MKELEFKDDKIYNLYTIGTMIGDYAFLDMKQEIIDWIAEELIGITAKFSFNGNIEFVSYGDVPNSISSYCINIESLKRLNIIFYFRTEEDRNLFKLTWG